MSRYQGQNPFCSPHSPLVYLSGVERFGIVDPGQDGILELDVGFDLVAQQLAKGQVADANPPPGNLVFVAGSDAATRRADSSLGQPCLFGVIQRRVIGHDQMGPVADEQPPFHAFSPDPVDLAEQGRRDRRQRRCRSRRSCPDEGCLDGISLRMCFFIADQDGVSGVVATLIASDDIESLGDQVNDLSLAFVTPLGSDYDDVCQFQSPTIRRSSRTKRPGGAPIPCRAPGRKYERGTGASNT